MHPSIETSGDNTSVWWNRHSILASVAEGTDSAIFVLNRERRVVWQNNAAAQLFCAPAFSLLGKRLSDVLSPHSVTTLLSGEEAIWAGQKAAIYEVSEECILGTAASENKPRIFRCAKYPFREYENGQPGRILGIVFILADITETARHIAEAVRLRHELKAFDQRFYTVVEDLNEGILLTDLQDRVLFANTRMTIIAGYGQAEMVGQYAYKLLLPPEEWPTMHARNQRRALNESESYEVVLCRKDGGTFWAHINAAPYRDQDGTVIGTVGAITDISARKQAEARIQWQAFHDPLTGLPNRTLFLERLEQSLTQARSHSRMVGVLFLDLDRFKNVNDTLGHDIGDHLLGAVSDRLVSNLSDEVTVARLGGDEFTLLLPEIRNGDEAIATANQVLHALYTPFTVCGQEFYLSASIGVSIYPQDGADAATLLKHADIAMYRAKTEGTGHHWYGAQPGGASDELLLLETGLRKAIEQEHLRLLYQPQIDLRSGRLRGFEALVRWQHLEHDLIPPHQFIPLAEATGLINPLGDWVLRTACRQTAEWRSQNHRDIVVSVNLSARQFRRRSLAEIVQDTLLETGLPPHLLDLELTETALLEDSEAAVENLRTLKALGANIAVDDFGTGYSSLAYLRRFPLDVLKIDQTFIRELAEQPTDQAIVRALIDMAHVLGLLVIAEGVETAAQRDILASLGCDLVQGFLISPPLTPAEAVEFAEAVAIHSPAGLPLTLADKRTA